MIERYIDIADTDPVTLYGVNNANLVILAALFPKLRIVARGTLLKVMGPEEALCAFEEVITALMAHCNHYNQLSKEALLSIAQGQATQGEGQASDNVLLYATTGRPIAPRGAHQAEMVAAYNSHDMLFVTGPAGTGKTYLAIALAVKALKNKEIRKIILSRPAVEAGEKLGFLPGDMKEKIDPYLQPLYDALSDMIPPARLREYTDTGVIQIAPLAFMRGRTLSDAVVILDEAQNTTPAQLKMFLTRMGQNTKMIVTGDVSQIDLPHATTSGLKQALQILDGIKGIAFIKMNTNDIVRHKLVTQIVMAYDRAENSATKSTENSKTEEL